MTDAAAQSQNSMSTDIEDRLAQLSDWLAAEHSDYVPVLREASSLIHDLREQVQHRARTNEEQTPDEAALGHLAGYCVRCNTPWPCESDSLRAERDALRNVVLNYLDDHARLVTNEALRERKRLLLPDELVPCACDICGYAERALSSPERSSSTAAPTDGRGNGDGHYHGDTFVPRDADD